MKIVLDTNVLVSGLIKPYDTPARILGSILNQELTLVLDTRILSEYRVVLMRPKFLFDLTYVGWLLDFFEHVATIVTPSPLRLNLKDPYDEPFLEVAIFASVDSLITGNQKHFPQSKAKGIVICSPSEFCGRYLGMKK